MLRSGKMLCELGYCIPRPGFYRHTLPSPDDSTADGRQLAENTRIVDTSKTFSPFLRDR